MDGDGRCRVQLRLDYKTILTSIGVGNNTIVCGPSSVLEVTSGQNVKLTTLLVKILRVECVECYLYVPYAILFCGV